MSTGTLGGVPVARATVQIPAWGRAWIDVDLSEAVVLSGQQTFTLLDYSQLVTIASGGVSDGEARYRCVAGFGGWGNALSRDGYANDAGIKITTVIQEAAQACGETVDTSAAGTQRMGVHFARPDGAPASWVLNHLAPRAWYVDTDGTTRLGARPTTEYTGDATRIRTDLSAQVIELATDSAIASLVPGVMVDGHGPATDVEYQLDSQKVIAKVFFGPAAVDRELDAYRRIVLSLFPRLAYLGAWEYRVSAQRGERLDLEPVRTATGMPELERVPWRPGLPGARVDEVPRGALVVVHFLDGDPSRPCVIGFDSPGAPGWLPGAVEFGDDSPEFLARLSAVEALAEHARTHTHLVSTTGTAAAQTGTAAASTTVLGDTPVSSLLKA